MKLDNLHTKLIDGLRDVTRFAIEQVDARLKMRYLEDRLARTESKVDNLAQVVTVVLMGHPGVTIVGADDVDGTAEAQVDADVAGDKPRGRRGPDGRLLQ